MTSLIYASLRTCERGSLEYLEVEFGGHLVLVDASSILPKTANFLPRILIPTPIGWVRVSTCPVIITNVLLLDIYTFATFFSNMGHCIAVLICISLTPMQLSHM